MVPVIYTRYIYMPDYADAPPRDAEAYRTMPGGFLGFGNWDAQITDDLAPSPGDIVIDKSRPSSFYGTRLEPLLTARQVRSLVVCGVTTNICVETTVRDAHQRGYDTVVVGDATAEFEISRQHHALFSMNWGFGGVALTSDVVDCWSSVAAPSLPV
jgi:ureidoacrylate peracid hydrolase